MEAAAADPLEYELQTAADPKGGLPGLQPPLISLIASLTLVPSLKLPLIASAASRKPQSRRCFNVAYHLCLSQDCHPKLLMNSTPSLQDWPALP